MPESESELEVTRARRVTVKCTAPPSVPRLRLRFQLPIDLLADDLAEAAHHVHSGLMRAAHRHADADADSDSDAPTAYSERTSTIWRRHRPSAAITATSSNSNSDANASGASGLCNRLLADVREHTHELLLLLVRERDADAVRVTRGGRAPRALSRATLQRRRAVRVRRLAAAAVGAEHSARVRAQRAARAHAARARLLRERRGHEHEVRSSASLSSCL